MQRIAFLFWRFATCNFVIFGRFFDFSLPREKNGVDFFYFVINDVPFFHFAARSIRRDHQFCRGFVEPWRLHRRFLEFFRHLVERRNERPKRSRAFETFHGFVNLFELALDSMTFSLFAISRRTVGRPAIGGLGIGRTACTPRNGDEESGDESAVAQMHGMAISQARYGVNEGKHRAAGRKNSSPAPEGRIVAAKMLAKSFNMLDNNAFY